jgi:DnaJ family protein C protein 3
MLETASFPIGEKQLLLTMRLLSTVLAFIAATLASADNVAGLYPPGLQPLVNKANALLTSGQFHDAAKLYSEAIEHAPTDYVLYYKRATAYLSLSKHSSALDDFDKVLSLTSDTFDLAYLMKARIHTRDGHFEPARKALAAYKTAKGSNVSGDVEELEVVIERGQRLRDKAEKESRAQLWNACVETSSSVLRDASHSIEIREWRAECALAAGDIESAVADLT